MFIIDMQFKIDKTFLRCISLTKGARGNDAGGAPLSERSALGDDRRTISVAAYPGTSIKLMVAYAGRVEQAECSEICPDGVREMMNDA